MLTLLRILGILLILWIIIRRLAPFLAGRPSNPARSEPGGSVQSNTVKDPVCGMYMDPKLAIRVPGKEGDMFFCSEECHRTYISRQA